VVETSYDAGHEPADLPYATEVVSFSPGPGAGFGHQHFPGIVLGPPKGYGVARGSMDVLSLGQGGSIVLGFTPRTIIDGPGPDFVVFENPFWVGGSEDSVFAELGRIAVSAMVKRGSILIASTKNNRPLFVQATPLLSAIRPIRT
jgi:hypothetical protein